MCLVLLAHRAHPAYRLILAANRDELHERPTAPLAEWPDAPGVFGGRDLKAGGTWLAISREGRWAAVTNFWDPSSGGFRQYSRGELVADFVTGELSPEEYARRIESIGSDFDGFNLLIGDAEKVIWTFNRTTDPDAARDLEPGIYGLSNHLLDTPWPKVVRGRRALREVVEQPELAPDRVLDLLLDRAIAADHDLPKTGITPELERALSAAFVQTPEYGTRCSSAILVDRDGKILFAERSFGPDGRVTGEVQLAI